MLMYRKDANFSVLSFTLNQKVAVTEFYNPEFSVAAFLAEVGGSLGLWLGVGAVQLLMTGIQLASKINIRPKI